MTSDEESFPIRYLDLAAEARQYTWTPPEPVRQRDPRLHPDTRPTSVQALDTQDQLATAETQRDLAQADADRHLRNARYLGGLLERIARTLGANPLDFAELPALVDGLRTTTDQLRIKAADHAHALDRAEAGATLWKTRLVHESQRLRGHLDKAHLTTARAEARAGAYCLAYDHLAAVTRTLVNAISVHAYNLDQPKAASLLDNLDTVRDTLSRDMESYLAEPYDDITPDTRVDLTPAGHAVASQPTAKPCQPGCGIGYHLQGCPHIGTQLGIAPDGSELAASSVPHVARESGHWACTQCGYQNAGGVCTHCGFVPAATVRLSVRREGEVIHPTDDVLCDIADEREAQDARLGELNYRDGTSRLLAGMADDARRDAQHTASQNRLTWLDVLAEQFWAAMAEEDPEVLRGRLVQVAAWAVAWAEAIDRRLAEAAGEDLMTPGMPNPCQPIGCDNGHHLPGCTYADETEAADHA
ncbi:hypothetical protein [Actinoplanes sp. NPDC049599]|uniref:hypothetical protein n=1 Tax=Actinoplanes sp. NPDC049599 TaxID=3363903 RepID=UPI0037ADCA53